MKYRKIKIEYSLCESDRFYRTFLVNDEMDLYEFGCAILASFYARLQHDYMFKFNNVEISSTESVLKDYKVIQLPEVFKFTYGAWEFNCVQLEETVYQCEAMIVLIDGAGQAIWENNINVLNDYLSGKLESKIFDVTIFDQGILPKNINVTSYSDFDNAFSLQTTIKCFYSLFVLRIRYLEQSAYTEPNNMIFTIVEHQINIHDYVKETYEKLRKKYSYDDAITMIYSVFIDESVDAVEENREFDEQIYIASLKELE